MQRQIQSNKRWSVVLVLLCMGLLAAFGWALDLYYGFPYHVGILIALGVAIVLAVTGYFGGDDVVLSLSRARPLSHDENPRLDNVVEEMAIAAGLPKPRVFVIEDPSPNAFATGRNPREATIAVTTGLLTKLNRDELQGVIAHELAHVRNYDTLFMTLIAVMVGTIALLSDAIWRTRWRGRGGRVGGQAQALLMLVALVLILLSPIAAKLIQLAASRRREYLADASAALITRYPAGLASALQKIAADPADLVSANRATQHMYIVNPLRHEGGSSLWSTHPPIEERIARLRRMAYLGEGEGARGPLTAEPPSAAPPAATPTPLSTVPATPPLPLTAAAALPMTPPAPKTADTNACPRCQEPLAKGRTAGQEVRGCRACGGIFLGEAALADLLARAPKRLADLDRRYPNRLGMDWQNLGDKTCPVCGTALRAQPLPQHPRTIVDRCPHGHGIWFDDQEVARVADARVSGP